MSKTKINRISEDLYLITLKPAIAGFDNFIGVWLKTGKPTFLIDVGPTATTDFLKITLTKLNVKTLDYIFLTHIHIDHAGGIGHLSEYFPETPIICHKAAIPHLSDPTRLWEGSLKTLGDTARAYGVIKPVSEKMLLDAEGFSHNAIHPIITPGHAPHHVSFITPQCLFAGETCGVHYRFPSGEEYQRPATPPRFFLETSLKSIDLLIEQNPEKICFGHFGMENEAVKRLTAHKEQLVFWRDILQDQLKITDEENFISDSIERLIREDPFMNFFHLFDRAEKEREIGFIINSIKGYRGFLETK